MDTVGVGAANKLSPGTEWGSADYGWAMWEQLSRDLDRRGTGQKLPKLLILAGDQVYNDDVEEKWMPALAASNNSEDPHSEIAEDIRKELIIQYTKFWGHASYRRVLAAIPSVAIWDDHDITDGWGGRPESFDPKIPGRFKAEWWTYFQLCREAFAAYQGSRNPAQGLTYANPVFTNIFDQGPNRFVLLDFRTEKNTSRRLLWERDHEAKVLHALNTTPTEIRRLFVVSPVVPFRTNFEGDRRLSKFSLTFFRVIQWIDQRKNWASRIRFLGRIGFMASLLFGFLLVLGTTCASLWSPLLDIVGYWWLYANNICLPIVTLMTGITGFCAIVSRALDAKELPRLSDDLDDGLSSEINRSVLTKLLRVLFDVQRRGVKVCLLTGDIHTCGMSEIVELRCGDLQSIPQAVASPVAYSPMPKVVEGFTTTTSEMVLSDNGGDYLMARNIFYTSRRNYCEIVPSELDLPQGTPFRFHLEGYRLPLVMAHQFLKE